MGCVWWIVREREESGVLTSMDVGDIGCFYRCRKGYQGSFRRVGGFRDGFILPCSGESSDATINVHFIDIIYFFTHRTTSLL